MAKDSGVRKVLGRSFCQDGKLKVKVLAIDFVALWDGTTMRCSLEERRLSLVLCIDLSVHEYH